MSNILESAVESELETKDRRSGCKHVLSPLKDSSSHQGNTTTNTKLQSTVYFDSISFKRMIRGSTSFNFCWSTNVEHRCRNLLNGIEPCSVFVQQRSTTRHISTFKITWYTVQHLLNSSCNICCSTNVEPCIIRYTDVAIINNHSISSFQQIGRVSQIILRPDWSRGGHDL